MAKQKEIKFRRDGKLFYGQQNGVKYSIHEARRLHEDESEQYYVSVNYPNERHRSFTTNGYRTFDLDVAKAFCQQVAAGEFDPAPIHAAQAAAKAEREKAALEHAAKQAAAFQGKLDAHRLDFSTLLELIHCYELHVGDQARLLLTEWEQQKAELNTDKDTLFRKLTQGIDTGLYGDKERAHSGPFQQDMVAYIMAKGSLTTAQASQLFMRTFTSRNTLYGVLREADDLLDLLLDLKPGNEKEAAVRERKAVRTALITPAASPTVRPYSSISLPPAVTGSCRQTSPTSMPVAFADLCSKKKMRTEVPNERPS